MGSSYKEYAQRWIYFLPLLVILAAFALNLIFAPLSYRLDLTQNSIYSLSKNGQQIIKKIGKPVTIRFYYSESTRGIPAFIQAYSLRIKEVLQKIASINPLIRVEVVDPKPDTNDEEWALRYGLATVRVNQNIDIFMGIAFFSEEKEYAIPVLDPRQEDFLEYNLLAALTALFKKNEKKTKLAVISSLPLRDDAPTGEGGTHWTFIRSLENFYDVEILKDEVSSISNDYGVLIILHPQELKNLTEFAIDQYIMKGGKALIAVDPFARFEFGEEINKPKNERSKSLFFSNLGLFFSVWDIDYDPFKIVGDMNLMTRVANGGGINYPFAVSFNNLPPEKITSNLKLLQAIEPGSIKLKEKSEFKFTPLIQTSAESGEIDSNLAAMLAPSENTKIFKSDGIKRTIAALISGKFKSVFNEKPAEVDADLKHIKEAEKETSVIVIADVDFLQDQNAVEKFYFGQQIMSRPINDNISFILNCIEFLLGEETLLSVRSSGRSSRPFSKVVELEKDAQRKWQNEEEKLIADLTKVQEGLNQVLSQRNDGNKITINTEQEEQIRKFQSEAIAVRSKLREVRKNLRENIEALGRTILLLNLTVIPVCIVFFGISNFRARSQRSRKSYKER